jgi:hypothetical chaperone protein
MTRMTGKPGDSGGPVSRERSVLGVDFGTTNSALAVVHSTGALDTIRFRESETRYADTSPSILFLEPNPGGPHGAPSAHTGGAAIRRYFEAERGRLVQSLKSYLPVRSFTSTFVYGRSFELEDLIALILRDLRARAEESLGVAPDAVVLGRPVHFAAAKDPGDDEFALARLTEATRRAGFAQVHFEYEPVAAAYDYEAKLDRDELILIGDFGGGTSDFCLVHVGPSWRGARRPERIVGTDGLGIAGDAFDRKIVRQVVEPALGRGSDYRSELGKILQVPQWLYGRFERWHLLSFLKTPETLKLLRDLERSSLEPSKLTAFRELVENDAGYRLYTAVERAKVGLSITPEAEFAFEEGSIRIRQWITRQAFEEWIAPELRAIRGCIERLLAGTSIAPTQVNRVFVTGGSSFVPAVRRVFEETLGVERVFSGDEFTSVARGLARSGSHLIHPLT